MFESANLSRWCRSISEAIRFQKLPEEWRRIVFYSEGKAYTKYLRPIVDELLKNKDLSITYLTSDVDDCLLSYQHNGLKAFFIGTGTVRTFLFQVLQANIVVMTMPDLQRYHLKRSTLHSVRYVYVQHSLVSTHAIYRPGAFDHYDAIFCAGPHHKREIRAWEKLNSLPEKRLFEHGYAPVDFLMAAAPEQRSLLDTSAKVGLSVLLAPSWGPHCLIECGAAAKIVQVLLSAGHRVIVRPHPMTARLNRQAVAALAARFGTHRAFVLERDIGSMTSLLDAHVMISDWSGVAMEFAFGLHRPVLFIDGPPKINNPRWAELGFLPLEQTYRSQVGMVMGLAELGDISNVVRRLWEARQFYASSAEQLSIKYVFNHRASRKTAARILTELACARDIDGVCGT